MPHLKHIVEDRHLTLGQIDDIVSALCAGTVPTVEKFDGLNVLYALHPVSGLRVARNKGDILAGGLSRDELSSRFEGRGGLQRAFVDGFDALSQVLIRIQAAVDPDLLSSIFRGGERWFSAEIVSRDNPNLLRYDQDAVVLHPAPSFSIVSDRVVESILELSPANLLEASSVASGGRPWRALGPTPVILDGAAATPSEVQATLRQMGSTSTTLDDFLVGRAMVALRGRCHGEMLRQEAARRLAEQPGCPALTKLRSRLDASTMTLLRGSSGWIAEQLAPLDRALVDLGGRLLAGTSSSLVSSPMRERRRLSEALRNAVAAVSASSNERAKEAMRVQLARLGDLREISLAMEGVVFRWGDDGLYKLTGWFGPINAIVGLHRYGRGRGIPAVDPERPPWMEDGG